MGPPIERWCQVSVEMGPPIERRCQVSNPLIKRNPPKFINFRPAEEPMKGFSRPMPFLAQKFRSGKTLHTSWPSSHIMTFRMVQVFQEALSKDLVPVSPVTLHSPCQKKVHALCLQCFNPSGTQSQWKDLVGQCPFLHKNSDPEKPFTHHDLHLTSWPSGWSKFSKRRCQKT